MVADRELEEHAAAVVLAQRLAEHEDEVRAWLLRLRAALDQGTGDTADALAELARLLGLRIVVLDTPPARP